MRSLEIPRRSPCRAFPLLAAVCWIAGCGDEPARTASSAGGFDPRAVQPCELLTASEIEAATGRAAAAGTDMSEDAAGVPMCRWPPVGGGEFETLVSVLVTGNYYDDYAELARSARDGPFADLFSEEDMPEVQGVGKFGVWMAEAGMLQAYGEGVMVQVEAKPAGGRDPLEASRTLARAALERLQ